jgi:hypothetical protein
MKMRIEDLRTFRILQLYKVQQFRCYRSGLRRLLLGLGEYYYRP